jgi:hypothetical protein
VVCRSVADIEERLSDDCKANCNEQSHVTNILGYPLYRSEPCILGTIAKAPGVD